MIAATPCDRLSRGAECGRSRGLAVRSDQVLRSGTSRQAAGAYLALHSCTNRTGAVVKDDSPRACACRRSALAGETL